jgi:hypothetical protein
MSIPEMILSAFLPAIYISAIFTVAGLTFGLRIRILRPLRSLGLNDAIEFPILS